MTAPFYAHPKPHQYHTYLNTREEYFPNSSYEKKGVTLQTHTG